MKYIIGIDSGGTKTEAIVYDLAGNEQQRLNTGFGNLLVDKKQGLANIKAAITGVLANRNLSECQLLVLGLAGIDSGGLKKFLAAELAEFQIPFVLLNDAQLAHYAQFKGESGILVIAGTGSVCLGMKANTWYRVGGWGHLFGDEGSGYYIGKCAVQQALAEYDAGLAPSLLTNQLFTHFNITNTLALVKVAYQLTKNQVAELAKIIAEVAPCEPLAANILTEAGHALGEEVQKTVNKMQVNNQVISIGLNGSVIEHNPYVRQAFFTYLEQASFIPNFIEKETSSTKGAYYYFKKNGAINK
ncbi:N-acetylglucosamine kinase-like BadF-type ATPase [Enterococcus sp. PF1-24]|uniref:N-acetylglucosamine kinase n=1 Tax=unclassified Enterococcus TaxID=2608891 RepID=UPI002475FCE8|nr:MULTISPECIES: BadF/BadG/BcrA/BcrD ATPase family protein [unclassified Enterococcus]MDH6364377.1 N-acetylglucosamine kinase-like BadF-type ATPase [Enterococcus sp. PFB1-1]MDH6401434.1 N-acetylglucosamine kinase-like BadF-type ATPase [Enterococcus sp. PF1-24]